MKFLFLFFTILCALKANAQSYLINFAGTGASANVISVKVENLTAGTTITLNGSDILRLTGAVGITQVENKQPSAIKIYPNPITDNSILQIYPPDAGDAIITIYDMTGKTVAQIHSYLENYLQEFRLSGINSGFYLISVKGTTYQNSGKLLCNGNPSGKFRIEKINNNQAAIKKTAKKDYKGALATVDMAYTTGDRLKFTGISGIYSTVMTDIPASDKTITFNFIACTDGDNNNYPVVTIDTQIWMAENLKTTKFKDGTTSITNITENNLWGVFTPAYCWYNNNEAANKATYGALYNWYAAGTGNLCPTGWHVPIVEEFTTLSTYLGATAGGKLKETGTTHWADPNTGATNESGFTALPGGYRHNAGMFSSIETSVWWWSATEGGSTYAWCRYLDSTSSNMVGLNVDKKNGMSVRCLKD